MSGSIEAQVERVLITGLSTYWGGRLAQALEQNEAIEAIIGVDSAIRRASSSAPSSCASAPARAAASDRRRREIDTVVDTA